MNSFVKVQAHSSPTCLCARKVVPSPAPRGVFCKRGLLKKLAHLLYYFLRNFFITIFFFLSLSWISVPPWSVRGPLMLSGCMNLWWLDAEDIVHRRWVWIFASGMTERGVTFDLPGGSSQRWRIAAIYGRMWTDPWSWDLQKQVKETKILILFFLVVILGNMLIHCLVEI